MVRNIRDEYGQRRRPRKDLRQVCMPRISSAALTSRVARPALPQTRLWPRNCPSGPMAAAIGPPRHPSVRRASAQQHRARCYGAAALPGSGPVKVTSRCPGLRQPAP